MKLWSITEQGSKKETKNKLSESDRKWVILSLIGVQGFLTVATFFSAIYGLTNAWQFFLGLNLLVFAGLYRTYRSGLKEKDQKLKQIQDTDTLQNKFSLTNDRSYVI